MQRADPQGTDDPGYRPQPVEEGVIDNVPDHRQRREQDTEPAHFNDRTLHEPCGGWGEDQRRQTFKAYRVDYPFRQRFALGVDLLHGLLPPVFI